MKSVVLTLLAAGAVLLAGCSSPTAPVRQAPVHAGTFSFVPTQAAPDFAEKRAQVQTLVRNAVTANLAQKNLTRVAESGNIQVAYVVVVDHPAAAAAVNDYLESGNDLAVSSPAEFGAGTLVIDVIDARTHKVIYRRAVTRRFLRNAPVDLRADRVQAAVDEALTGLNVASEE